MPDNPVRVGFRPPRSLFADPPGLAELVQRAEAGGLARLVVGDHVGFRGGHGFDGLVHATVLAALTSRITVTTAVYLLALRHPVAVARQISSLTEFAPGRFEFDVGIGGEDPAEYRMCDVDPSSRGARTDEALGIVRSLLAGATVTEDGRHFSPDGVSILPTPRVPVPVLVGGRSPAAWRRAARHGDGWIALWVSPRRYAEGVATIAELAEEQGRPVPRWRHALHVWCGFGPGQDTATDVLAAEMEALYGRPFADFARYCPVGQPRDVAAALAPYVAAGCRDVNLIGVARTPGEALDETLVVADLLGRTV